MKKLPTGARVHKIDHFHDQRCASCLHPIEDDDHVLKCTGRKRQRANITKQISTLRNTGVDDKLCDILQEGISAYFKGECMSSTMIRMRGKKDMGRYKNLIDEQTVIGWDNLLRGKFSKEWRIQQKAYKTRLRLVDPIEYDKIKRMKKRKQEQQNEANRNKNTAKNKSKNKTEAFHAFFQAIVPILKEIWKERCVDRNTPVIGGRIAAEYDSLTKKITHLYTLRTMVLPEDEIMIYDASLETRLNDTNQQLKKWINRWKIIIDYSMKRVKEMAQDKSKPIWKHFTANKPAKTKVSRKLSTRKPNKQKRMCNNPLTNVFQRMKKKRSSSRVIANTKVRYKKTTLIEVLYNKLGKRRSTSRETNTEEIETQTLEDRFGDEPK